jgi:site-specific recombinase XerD
MSVSIRKKNGKLYLDIYENGTRKWEALHMALTNDKDMNKEIMRLAETCRAKRELQVVSGEWGLIDRIASKKTLYSFVQEMSESGKYAGRIHYVLKYLASFSGGRSIQIGQVNKKWIEDFYDYLLNNLGRNSAHSYAIAIRQALHKAVKDKIILKNPALEAEMIKKQETNKVFLNIDEIQKIADITPQKPIEDEVRVAFLFGCYTGLRISDIVSLLWGEIEHNPLQIVKRQKKTKVNVYIPLSNIAWSIINDGAVHNHESLIFPFLGIDSNHHIEVLQRLACRAGIQKHIGWHTARHTFAVRSLESGADIYTVSKLLGHKDIKTTQVYAKATDKMKREAVNAIPEINIGRA